jgi:hypothetical protein
MKKFLTLSYIIFLNLGLTDLYAQETVAVSGGVAKGSDGSASYSIGQALYNTHTGSNGSVAHGVQQPYEISIILGINGTEGISLTLLAYPNPTKDVLTLKVENYNSENLYYKVIDLNGKLLEFSKLNDYETQIAMSKYPPALYLLKVYDSQKEIRVFKVVKH